MPRAAWKPMIVLSRSLGAPRLMAEKILELKGHPGVLGALVSSSWFTEDPKVVLAAFKKAKLKLYLRPESLWGLEHSDLLRRYEDMGVDALVVPCAHTLDVFEALAKADPKFKLVLSMEEVGMREPRVYEELPVAFRIAAARQPFDGVAFPSSDVAVERPESRSKEPLFVWQYAGKPEESAGIFGAGATHLLIPEGVFSTPRSWADRFWPVVQTLNPGARQ